MEPAHIEGLFEAGRYPEIWTYTQGNLMSIEGTEEYVRAALAKENALTFVIENRATGKVIGSTRFYEISKQNRSLEIGNTWLTPGVWRTAVNTECKYLLLKYCFESLGTVRVQFKTDARNLRSQAAISRLGAVKEGVLRKHMIYPNGFIRDSVYFSIIDSDWPSVKDRLEKMLK